MSSPSWLVVVALLAGCGDDAPEGANTPQSRVVAIQSDEPEVDPDFCDVAPEGTDAPRLTFPELAEGTAPARDGWQWVNVWATWCKPCVEEIPLLTQWEDELDPGFELVLLSADADAEAVTTFRSEHPEMPETLRLADVDGLPAWVETLGLDEGAPLPVHILVDPEGRVRCARAGAVEEDDRPTVTHLLSQG